MKVVTAATLLPSQSYPGLVEQLHGLLARGADIFRLDLDVAALPEVARRTRFDIVARALERMNLNFTVDAALPAYLWVETPPGFASSADFAAQLLAEAMVVVASAGAETVYAGCVRLSLTESEARLEEALECWERWLIGKALGISLPRAVNDE